MDFTLQLAGRNESDLIQACLNNERWAQKQLYEDNYGIMMTICMRYAASNDDALDILHESFIKIFKNLHKYQVGTSLIAWVRKIVINTSIDFYRRDLRRRSEELEVANYINTDIPDALSNLTSEEILKALQQLPHSYRSVFNLYVIEGYSHKEIAEMLSINESTCRSNLVKARCRLREYLLKYDS
jgi:RNA polymerase sigma-70 factor (ECF subfamily)